MSPFLSPLILYKTEAQPDEVELQTITIARLYWLDYSFTSLCVSSGGKLIKNISFLFCRGERRKSEGGEIRQSEHATENNLCQILKN